jgi:hypothetical protein
VFVWSHDAVLDARLDALHVPQAARAAASLARVGIGADAASPAAGTATPDGKSDGARATGTEKQAEAARDAAQSRVEAARVQPHLARAQAEALGAALRAVALVSALCALAGAALAALTISPQRPL